MVFSFWLDLRGRGDEQTVRLSLHLRPLEIRTLRPFGTAHSSTSFRTNAFLSVKLGPFEGLSEVGLPPFKAGIYEGRYSDCENLITSYATVLVNALEKQAAAWFSSHSPKVSEVWNKGGSGGGGDDDLSTSKLSLISDSKVNEEKRFYSDVAEKMIEVLDYCLSKNEHPRSAFALIETGILKCLSNCISVPIPRLLGIELASEKPINCFYTVGITDDLTELIENICYGKSHTSFIKLKVDKDLSKARHVFRLLGEEGMLRNQTKTIAIDANCSWTPEIAMEFLRDFEEYRKHIYMVEQPFPFDTPFDAGRSDFADWSRVKRAFGDQGIDIYADESMRTSSDLEALAPLCHGVNIKLEKTGGFREAAKAQKLCQSRGIKVWLGCMVGTSLNCNSIVDILPLCNSAADMDGFLLTSPECQPCKPNFYLTKQKEKLVMDEEGLYGTIVPVEAQLVS
jgi:L-alanine-DL-glutamate epimerase-like enolase superfamily enzyme